MADYPIFTGGFIYADGMLWGAKVKGDGLGDEVRVGGSTYNHGMKAGRIITDASGNVLGSDDPAGSSEPKTFPEASVIILPAFIPWL